MKSIISKISQRVLEALEIKNNSNESKNYHDKYDDYNKNDDIRYRDYKYNDSRYHDVYSDDVYEDIYRDYYDSRYNDNSNDRYR